MQIGVGILLLIISLFFGFWFFLYAIRYYISVLNIVIKLLRNAKGSDNSVGSHANGGYRIRFPLNENNNNVDSIRNGKSLNNIYALRRPPFISIHIALYNEKTVVDRLMKALTSLDYPDYEIIVVDDSTDETYDILMKRWGGHPRVKIIHREERRGFKGGALREALRHMDPRTKYVVVFDADFIPPSNILWTLLSEFRNNYNDRNKSDFKNRLNNFDYYERRSNIIKERNIVAVQGYQWHVLNAGENWITQGVRAAYAGNYLVDHLLSETLGGFRMINGSVFMIRADVLKRYKWRQSLTEDWDLTLRLYRDGYKVKYSMLAAAPAECPSTLARLIRQNMRWAEGHSFAAKKYFLSIMRSKMLSFKEKIKFMLLTPYYVNGLLYLVGMTAWFLREFLGFPSLFWISVFGWSLLIFNMAAIPLICLTGLYMEYSLKKNLQAPIASLILMHLMLPFIALAALKGFLESQEGTWIRTPKTGKITETPIFRLRGLIRWARQR